jgi:hypothetical protein
VHAFDLLPRGRATFDEVEVALEQLEQSGRALRMVPCWVKMAESRMADDVHVVAAPGADLTLVGHESPESPFPGETLQHVCALLLELEPG